MEKVFKYENLGGTEMTVYQLPAWEDNYIYLIHPNPRTSNELIVIDPTDARIVESFVKTHGFHLAEIWNTHHHPDHVGGNLELKSNWNAVIRGPSYDKERIPGIDFELDESSRPICGNYEAQVIFLPGHTRGHIAFWFKMANSLFVGDTLFSLGCGRLFEGTPQQMWTSLQKIRMLPDETFVFCSHEYTKSNFRFAHHLEPKNKELQEFEKWMESKLAQQQPTVPTLLGVEKRLNPFLRADDPELQNALYLSNSQPEEVFAHIRERKDHF